MWRSRWFRIPVLLLVLGIVGALIIRHLAWTPPSWYAPLDDETTEQLAQDVENRLLEETHRIREEDEPWRLRVRDEQINAWLSARLRKWIDHDESVDWPAWLGTPQVRLVETGLEVAAPIRIAERERPISATLAPTVNDGQLHLPLSGFAIGRLPMRGEPFERLRNWLADHLGEETMENPELSRAMDILAGREGLEPDIRLQDGRRLRLIDVRMSDGSAVLSFETLPRPARAERDDDERRPLGG